MNIVPAKKEEDNIDTEAPASVEHHRCKRRKHVCSFCDDGSITACVVFPIFWQWSAHMSWRGPPTGTGGKSICSPHASGICGEQRRSPERSRPLQIPPPLSPVSYRVCPRSPDPSPSESERSPSPSLSAQSKDESET